jgi:RNA polymerase sigma factor (sigma-70 family)
MQRDEVLRRAVEEDRSTESSLGSECLVFLIRHFHRAGDSDAVKRVARTLITRSKPQIRKWLPHTLFTDGDARRQAVDSVIGELFTVLLDLDTDKADFYQAAFGRGVKTLALRAFNRIRVEQRRSANSVSVGDPGEGSDDESEGDFVYTPVDPDALPDQRVMLLDAERALASMPEHCREAFRLRYYWDLSIESISAHFEKDPKTIHNWLKRAEKALVRWRERNQ